MRRLEFSTSVRLQDFFDFLKSPWKSSWYGPAAAAAGEDTGELVAGKTGP
jgi:hypothetical protein